ncbi:MAG: HEAT repeat domain-containing protein [Spirochaetaceae bacterium]|nr:MAG: HEAT repeat domain-containing protein [Spirochaetaceae bacterium]
MQQAIDYALGVPPSVLAVSGVAIVVLVGVLVWHAVLRALLRRNLEAVLAAPELAEGRIRARYRSATLLLHSALIEKIARQQDHRIVALSGIDTLWIERLARRRSPRDAARVMEFAAEKGMFTCFIAALDRRQIAHILQRWISSSEDFLPLRRVALSGRGEQFDGAAAYRFFSERIDEIREMVGDPEWPVRYFATKIILNDADERSERMLWSCFADAHRQVRLTVAAEFRHTDRDALYEKLYNLYLHDPVFDVRRQARRRIGSEFSDLFRIDAKKLSEVEAFHVLELLQPGSTEDEAVAFRYLAQKNLELRLPAAHYLQQCGALVRIFRRANPGDQVDFDRTERLLRNACEVNIAGFLDSVNAENPGSLLLAARILTVVGSSRQVRPVAERIFALPRSEALQQEMYQTALDAIQARGVEDSFQLLQRELLRWQYDEQRAGLILARIPLRAETVLVPTLLALLRDPQSAARDALEQAVTSMPTTATLPALLQIIREGSTQHPHNVRMSALKIIGRLKLPFCLQFLLENLATLDPQDAREFIGELVSFTGKAFDERAAQLLEAADASTRAALILSLPATANRDYLKAIREAIGDSDPDVRVAAVWALQLYGDTRSLNQAHDLLRDPVERVRREAATVLGRHGTPSVLEKLRALLNDENEVNSVKRSAIEGLGASEQARSITVLVEMLAAGDHWDQAIIEALARKCSTRQVEALMEQIKDAEPRVRSKLSRVFRMMGAPGESAMVELLQQDIASLRPHVTAVLEELGFVEATIRKLAHRDPAQRRDAARTLSIIASKAAFRGIVVAARDPDPEVRVLVTRAIDKLSTRAGKQILEDLQNDPDRRVRKYTLWAMERQRTNSL